MFEAEVAMEKRSSFLPMLLMLMLLVLIVGTVVFVALQVRGTPLAAEEARAIATAALQGPGPAVIHFSTGLVRTTADDDPSGPNYRLLEKAGILKLTKAKKGGTQVALTADGERIVTALPGFKKSPGKDDGTFSYRVPLAQRQLVAIEAIHRISPNAVVVEYTWKWIPNQVGEAFDAGGPLVKGFGVWERQTLINKYQADFYHGDPAKATLALVHGDEGWKIATR
jgi:hypothetical protein